MVSRGIALGGRSSSRQLDSVGRGLELSTLHQNVRNARRFVTYIYVRTGAQSIFVASSEYIAPRLAALLRLLKWHSLWTRWFGLQRHRIAHGSGNHSPNLQALLPRWNVINLFDRPDRLAEITKEMKRLGIPWNRIGAVKNSNGALGCASSHLSILKRAGEVEEAIGVVVVAEDDLIFEANASKITAVVADFLDNDALDVLCISHRTKGISIPVSKHLRVANEVYTTSAYIVKRRAVPNLVRAFEKSEAMLRVGIDKRLAAIDVVWHQAQLKELLFAIPRERIARQRPSYSDVANKHADYRY